MFGISFDYINLLRRREWEIGLAGGFLFWGCFYEHIILIYVYVRL